MNFFLPKGSLDIAGAKIEPSPVEVTETKSIHSSEDELDRKESDLGKLASLSRRQKTRGLINRKYNKEFRSVWYDDETAEEDILPALPGRSGLTKAVSLDNLLDLGGNRLRSRSLVTKKMISSPSRPRRIVGNWTRAREVQVENFELQEMKINESVETASVAVEYFSMVPQQNIVPSSDSVEKVEYSGVGSPITEAKVIKVDQGQEERLVDTYAEVKPLNLISTYVESEETKSVVEPLVIKSDQETEILLQDEDPTVGPSNRTEVYVENEQKEIESVGQVLEGNPLVLPLNYTEDVNIEDAADNIAEAVPDVHVIEEVRKEKEEPKLVAIELKEEEDMEEHVPHTVQSNIATSESEYSLDKEDEEERNTPNAAKGSSEEATDVHPATKYDAPSASIENRVSKEESAFQAEAQDLLDTPDANVLPQPSVCASSDTPSGSEVVELQPFSPSSPSSTCPIVTKESKTVEMVVVGEEVHYKKHVPLERAIFGIRDAHFKKNSTLDGRGRLKKGGKIDISGPTLPKKLEGAQEVDMSSLDTQGITNLLKHKSKSTNDLLKTFSQIKNDKSENLNNPKFPISENDELEDDVQIRRHQSINQYRCSKTTDFDFGRKWSNNAKDFEAKGLSKIWICSEPSPIKFKRVDTLKYQNGHFYKVDDTSKKVLKSNVTLKSARLTNKRDVELKDSNNLTYILYFDSSKDAKLFLENERVRCYAENDNKSTITRTLLRLLGKRSSREMLEKKGIYQNEPIFGNTLRNIYNTEKGVPAFILRTTELIERPENITSLGIYRTSGNLATIQKIRFEVDKGRLGILNDYCKDVDVLTGCLKLFFRELKEPLIPCDVCDSLLSVTKAHKNYSKSDREHIRQIISKLPEANSETLYVLIRHLIEVVKYKEENKMDTYNLSVCWGPTIIFTTDPTPLALTRDPMAQTADAARGFDALLTFYIEHPEELDFSRRMQDHLDSNRNTIQRQDSKESVWSFDSNNSKPQKKSGSNSSLNVDEVLKKSIELIEANINSEGLYKKPGSTEKINKIMKRMMKKKVGELERHKSDTNDLADSLKRYLREMPEVMVTQECVEQVNKFCDNGPCLEPNNRQRIVSVVESLPKKDTLVYILKHIIRVMEHEPQHNVSKADMILIWTNVLNFQKRVVDSHEKFSRFLRAALEVFDESKADVMPSPKGLSNGLLNDLKNYQKDKDRISKYDNVPDLEGNVVFREATILEEKTEEAEHTKL